MNANWFKADDGTHVNLARFDCIGVKPGPNETFAILAWQGAEDTYAEVTLCSFSDEADARAWLDTQIAPALGAVRPLVQL